MATCAITGTIHDATDTAVENVVVKLGPEAPHPSSAEAIGGVGIHLGVVEIRTDPAGAFSINVVQGFRFRLQIEAIGFDRVFVCPSVAGPIRFDTLALEPEVESVVDFIDLDTSVIANTVTLKCEPISTLLERFDRVAIDRSTAGRAGPWTEIGLASLEDDTIFYKYEDAAANTSWHYRGRYEHSLTGDVSQGGFPVSPTSNESQHVLTTGQLSELYLFGVDLTDDDGNPFPERMLQHYVDAAISWLQHELDIPIVQRRVVETHDHYGRDYARWGYFQLNQYPVAEVETLTFQYPSMTDLVTISSQWIVLEDEGQSGVIQIVPGQGNIADVLLIPGSVMPMWDGASGRVPSIWTATYKAGFAPGAIPTDLIHAVGMMASIGVLNIAGDLIAGAGIANVSVSVPGLSQNIGTTSSATNSGYGARIIEYQKELKEMMPNLRRYYGKGTRMVVA